MAQCPNKNLKEWQVLVNTVGETETYRLYAANNYDIPNYSKEELDTYNHIMNQRNVLKRTLPRITSIEIDPNLKGKAELVGNNTKVLLNPKYATKDSLFHEYGHALIDMLGYNSRLVQQAIDQLRDSDLWGNIATKYSDKSEEQVAKEVLAQAIGKEADIQFTSEENLNRWKRILNRILSALKSKLGIEQDAIKKLANKLVNPTNFTPTLKTNEIFERQQQRLDDKQIKEATERLKNFKNDIKFDEKNHTYTLIKKAQPLPLDSVTTLKDKLPGYGIGETTDKTEALMNRANQLGTLLHYYAEVAVTGEDYDINKEIELGFELSTKARNAIAEIVDEIRQEGGELLSEVVVYDELNAVAGTIDLVQIHNDGTVTLYDFKSRERGWEYYDKPFKAGEKSYRDKHSLQLSAYRQILERNTPFRVRSTKVIRMVPHVPKGKNVIGNVSKSRTVSVATNPDVSKIITQTNDATYDKTIDEVKSTIEHVENMQTKLASRLQAKLKSAKNLSTERRRELIEDVERVQEPETGTLGAMTIFLRNAIEDINGIFKSYENAMDAQANGDVEAFNLKMLSDWNDVVSGYDLLDKFVDDYLIEATKKREGKIDPLTKELRQIMNSMVKEDNPSGLHGVINGWTNPETGEFNQGLMQKYNKLKDLYITKGSELMVDFYSKNSTRIIAEFKARYREEYAKLSDIERNKMSYEEYEKSQLNDNVETIEEQTKELFKEQVARASRDINSARRFFDSILSSPDPIISAVGKAFVKNNEKVRKETVVIRDEIVDLMQEYEKKYGRLGNQSDAKRWDWMLETDKDGNYTGHFLTEINSEMWIEREKYKDDPEALKKWDNDNRPLQRKAQMKALKSFLNKIKEEGKINIQEYDKIVEYVEFREQKLESMVDRDIAQIIHMWLSANTARFRRPINKWRNTNDPKFKQLQADIKDNNIRGRLYTYMMDKMEEADNYVGHRDRLFTKLPGVQKSLDEAKRSGEFTVAELAKYSSKNALSIRADEEKSIKTRTDIKGKPIYSLPVYYTNNLVENTIDENGEVKVNSKMQSFDVPSIVYKRISNTLRQDRIGNILPEIELTREILRTREVVRTDSKLRAKWNAFLNEPDKIEEATSNMYNQFEDWVKQVVYGDNQVGDMGEFDAFGTKIDVAKGIDLVTKYAALNMLSLNWLAGTANVVLGETLQRAEAIAGEFITNKSLKDASKLYRKNFFGILDDIGRRKPENIVNQLEDEFHFLNDYDNDKFNNDSKFKSLMRSDSLFFNTNMGEHFMQMRFGLGMLAKIEAKDKNGNVIGNMLEMYEQDKDGKLKLNDNVDLEQSKWTEDDRLVFSARVREVLARIHGDYRSEGKVAVQRYALGRAAFQFRKFIPKGAQRRWGRREYNEQIEDYVEGNYISFLNYIKKVGKDLRAHKLAAVSKNWQSLSSMELANIKRSLTEISALTTALLLSYAMTSVLGDIDEDDDKFKYWLFNTINYQSIRLRSEIMFFTNPVETLRLLRSPAASMSIAENIVKLLYNVGSMDVYERGDWKGHFKWEKDIYRLIPFANNATKALHPDDMTKYFNQ